MIGSQLRPSISSGRYVAVVVYIAAAKLVISFGLQSGKSKKVSFYPLPPVDNLVLAKAGEVPEETLQFVQGGVFAFAAKDDVVLALDVGLEDAIGSAVVIYGLTIPKIRLLYAS